MECNGRQHLRDAECVGDLPIGETFEKPQREDLGGARAQFREGLPEGGSEFAEVGTGDAGGQVLQWDPSR